MSVYRVLHIVHKMSYGGIETFLMNIYRNIDREEIQFDFAVHTDVSGDYDEEIRQLGGNIYYFTSRRKNIIKYYRDWKKFLKDNKDKYIAIHMHVSSLTTILPLKIAKKYGIKKRFMHAHNTYQKGTMHNILNKLHQNKIDKIATKCLACSTEAGKYMYGDKHFELVNNAICAKKYSFNQQKRSEIRKKMNLENKFAILHIGRFNYQKNHKFLIKIFGQIVKKEPNARLFLIGTGELQGQIRNSVKERKLEDKVYFLNTRSDINDIMQAMDVFVFPSWHEGLPVVLIEAQAAGLKIIASDSISKEVKITDLLEFVSLSDNPETWAEIVLKNKEYNRENTYKHIVNAHYDIEDVIGKLKKYYMM